MYYRDIMKGRVSAANFIIILFLKLPQPPQTFSSHHPDLSAAMNVKARPSTSSEFILTEGSSDSSFFLAKKYFLIKVCTFFLASLHGLQEVVPLVSSSLTRDQTQILSSKSAGS